MGSQTFDDIMEWGRLRIEGKAIVCKISKIYFQYFLKDEKIIKRGIPNLSDIIEEDENKTENSNNTIKDELKSNYSIENTDETETEGDQDQEQTEPEPDEKNQEL